MQSYNLEKQLSATIQISEYLSDKKSGPIIMCGRGGDGKTYLKNKLHNVFTNYNYDCSNSEVDLDDDSFKFKDNCVYCVNKIPEHCEIPENALFFKF